MVPITSNYISRSWASEIHKHERTIANLRIKMEKLAKELSWELEQHHSRMQELNLLDTPLSEETAPNSTKAPTRERAHKTFVHREEKACDIHPFGEPALIRMTGKRTKKAVPSSNRLELPV